MYRASQQHRRHGFYSCMQSLTPAACLSQLCRQLLALHGRLLHLLLHLRGSRACTQPISPAQPPAIQAWITPMRNRQQQAAARALWQLAEPCASVMSS